MFAAPVQTNFQVLSNLLLDGVCISLKEVTGFEMEQTQCALSDL